jgi:hypothetical protein
MAQTSFIGEGTGAKASPSDKRDLTGITIAAFDLTCLGGEVFCCKRGQNALLESV